MGDHFTLLVDRLLTESTLEATIESQRLLHLAATSASKITAAEFSQQKMDFDLKSCPRKLVDCRICHEEDEDSNMEMPCSCCGSLKYAHRKCVQRWCNEKGDTICEICRQQFKHGYTAPPPLFHYSRIPMTFRGNLEIPRRDIHSHRFMDIVPSNHEFLDSDFEDYSAHSPRSLLCCRIVAIIFMVLLVLRHTLPIVISGAEDYSLRLFMLVLLRTVGILLPIYVVVKAFTNVNRRRHQLVSDLTLAFTNRDLQGFNSI
ncbi:hypothetical protein K2173_001376 [Erythroxylum novogranatense]|uniref:RING-CH-type domain-containing protein n=1 Tax=Erythroxylum novogranatense TaxID=1862640 RepID=A0AAV8T3I5_9ROSI|nr:hypothetical protein K2173_001376 [Erythroxylum novogranatense]